MRPNTMRANTSLVAVVCAGGVCGLASLVGAAPGQSPSAHPDLRQFFVASGTGDGADDAADDAIETIAAAWRDGYAGIVWDMLRFMRPPRRPILRAPTAGNPNDPFSDPTGVRLQPEHPTTRVYRRLIRLLEAQTGERFGNDSERWQQWIWQQPYDPHPDYALFKGAWYGQVDPRFRDFFPPGVLSLIRLDEVDWGGVAPNGIPPLEYPEHLAAEDADYLDADDIVFAIAVNGDARAYPKRILAWHEMALDRVGGLELTVVYCTLCGTVIPYESVVDGEHIRFGTSGLLYRSNKLMFDQATKSLWSTLEGVPVVGGRVGSGAQLTRRSMVTTTWGEWRAWHPETTVLSLETGHERDYDEGAAYRDYFRTDRLMFQVQARDDRLDNKDEVVVMLFDGPGGDRYPLALSVDFLEDHPLFQGEAVGQSYVVVTSQDGANRVYRTGGQRFERQLDDFRVADVDGRVWRVTEDGLIADEGPDTTLARLPAHRAFWFGWYAQFPQTELIR